MSVFMIYQRNMFFLNYFTFFFSICMLACFAADFAKIQILQPQELMRKYPSSYLNGLAASFGEQSWKENMVGKLYYDENNRESCVPGASEALKISSRVYIPRIQLVDRGQCHFVKKALIAQNEYHAMGLIIVDYEHESMFQNTDVRSLIISDNGYGHEVRIPSMLIRYEDGEILKQTLKEGEPIWLRFGWSHETSSTVEVHQWMSPSVSTSMNFLSEFAPYAVQFESNLIYIPHFWVFSIENKNEDFCIEDGKYCAFAPDFISSNVIGRDIVYEIMREVCLWYNTLGRSDGTPKHNLWWAYIEKLKKRCLSPEIKYDDNYSLENCSYLLMAEVGIDVSQIRFCVEKDALRYLDIDIRNHAWSPNALTINDSRFSGVLDAIQVTTAICKEFTAKPKICELFLSGNYSAALVSKPYGVNQMNSEEKKTSQSFIWSYVIIVILIIVLTIVCAYFIRRYLQQFLQSELKYHVFNQVKYQLNDMQAAEVEPKPLSFNYKE